MTGPPSNNLKSIPPVPPLPSTPVQLMERMPVCQACQSFATGKCSASCGCNGEGNPYLRASYCPLGKWPDFTA